VIPPKGISFLLLCNVLEQSPPTYSSLVILATPTMDMKLKLTIVFSPDPDASFGRRVGTTDTVRSPTCVNRLGGVRVQYSYM
jgi:hypothetical protein